MRVENVNTMIMKYKIFLWVFLLSAFTACEDDENVFGIMPETGFRFEPKAGGAMLFYTLPGERDIYGIKVNYTNAQGEEVTKKGSFGGDSLLCDGFNEKRTNVPVKISYLDRFRNESEALETTFDTEDSAPYVFLTGVHVESSWNGFQVLYEAPEEVTGMVHVFYLGTNLFTQQEDTLLLESFTINRGGDTLTYDLKSGGEKNTIVLRVDDFKGYRVGEKVFSDVLAYQVERLVVPKENWDFSGVPVVTREDEKVGVDYLFDGDRKGEQRLSVSVGMYYDSECFTFLAGPNALNKPFIVDLGGEKIPAFIRIYAMQNLDRMFPGGVTSVGLANVWWGHYGSKLPCEVTLYASNDKEVWEKVGHYLQNENATEASRWYYQETLITSQQELAAADSVYFDVKVRASEKTYRYLKMEVNKTFYNYEEWIGNYNAKEYVTMHELEIYVKKD